jgi:mono/diheme cytochrome c family protein
VTAASGMARALWALLAALAVGAGGYVHVQALHQVQAVRAQPPFPAALPWLPAIGAETQPAHQSTRAPSTSAVPAREILDKYCVTCHNARTKTAGLLLDTLDPDNVGANAEQWEKVASKLRTREMPPPGLPRPDQVTYDAVATLLENNLDAFGAAHPNPGRVAVHRLNRAEYTNAVRDLLGLQVDGGSLPMTDEPDQHGFDNIANLLSVSTARLERYMSAARRISRLAVADPTINPVVETYSVPAGFVQDDRTSEDLPFGSQGGVAIDHFFPVDGDYNIKVLLKRQVYLYIMGMGEPHQLDIRVDGVLAKRISIGGEGKGMTAPEGFAGNTQGDPGWEVYMHTADAHLEVRVPVKTGVRKIGVSFVRQYWKPEGIAQPPQTGYAVVTNDVYYGNPSVESVMIDGPYNAAGKNDRIDMSSRGRIFVCRPGESGGQSPPANTEEPCARQILTTLATRAYRRPLTEEDTETLVEFYKAGRAAGTFSDGIQRGLERILASPSFLFRIERGPANLAAGSTYRLGDLELASRMSFFIWSSIPDEELLNLAVLGRLKDPAVVEQQVKRMLADPRSDALVDNFANQWLKLGKIVAVKPDEYEFPEFDENLRGAIQEETKRFIAGQLHEDRSVTDLLSADYTFVNDRLARHYGIPNIYGSQFRKATFKDGIRGGLLGQASILTATSYPNRTSPVVRGRWLLENMLGAPPPPPPPDVPALKESGAEGQPKSVRERMEGHRKNPTCAACHVRMDPLGFSLENFDGLGKWRTMSDGVPIDASASLPDGTRFEGVLGLRKLLLAHRADFVRTLTEKMLAYAIGRSVEYYDLPAVRQVTRSAAPSDYRWSAVILGIVRSTPFTMSTAGGDESRTAPPASGVATR